MDRAASQHWRRGFSRTRYSAPDLSLSAISLSPLRLRVIFSRPPKFLLSVLQEIGASPFQP
jgi:hypothetical protein